MDSQHEGRADRVLRELIEEGHLDDAIRVIAGMLGVGDDGHDISVAFRACLIGQGFEAEAMRMNQVILRFHPHGFTLQIDPISAEDALDFIPPDLKAVMDRALIWVMRGANIDAYIDDDGGINNRGKIRPTDETDVEALVGQFKAEIDEQFPDTPPPAPRREGTWW